VSNKPRLGENIGVLADKTKRRLEGKVTPEVLSAVLLDEMTGKLSDIVTLLDTTNQRLLEQGDVLEKMYTEMAKKPQGISDSFKIAVSDTLKPLTFTEPFQSIDVHNDGPNPVRYALNKQGLGTAEIRPGEWKIIDLHDANIQSVRFQCALGETANLRIFAVR